MDLKQSIKFMLKKLLMQITNIEPMILFESFDGKQYSDNPRAISEKMHENYPEYKIIWHLNKNANRKFIPAYVECVEDGIEFYKALFSSFCYVKNTEFHDFIELKKKDQLYIQTWHGDRGFKKILWEADPKWAVESKVCDAEVDDIALAGSSYGENTYKNAFRFYGHIVNLGCPRNERMLQLDAQDKDIIRKRLEIDSETKVLLYAPTFRDDNKNGQNVAINLEETIDAIKKKYGGKWVVVVRGHVGKKLNGFDENACVIDATNYPDMADLLAISDFLISDYSSTALDFYLTGKPIVLAVFDIDHYEKCCREFKLNPLDSGFICAKSQEELLGIINELSEKKIEDSYKIVDAVFGTKETGLATLNICKIIDDFFKEYYVK